MRRTTDVDLVNKMLCRDWPGADLSEAIANPLNVCIVEGDSGALFAWRGPGIYEIHLFYAVRGREALRLFDSMLGIIQSAYGGRFFWAMIPLAQRRVRMFARLAKFHALEILETQHGPEELFALETAPCRLSQ